MTYANLGLFRPVLHRPNIIKWKKFPTHIYSSQTVFLGLTTVLFCVEIVLYVYLFLCKTLLRFGDLASYACISRLDCEPGIVPQTTDLLALPTHPSPI